MSSERVPSWLQEARALCILLMRLNTKFQKSHFIAKKTCKVSVFLVLQLNGVVPDVYLLPVPFKDRKLDCET